MFDRHSGIDLVDAVAASTSAMTPYRLGERRYINGGYRRNENADPATRLQAARGGYDQCRTRAEQLTEFWRRR